MRIVMTTARQRVLDHLKKTRLASAREIARALKMSAPTVRHHLGILVSDGRIEMVSVEMLGGRGRPEKKYSLSQASLGDNLAVLADALLMGQVNVKLISERIAESHGLVGNSDQPLMKKLVLLVERLNEMHYQSRWEAGAEGPRVIFGRCPYAKIIEKHQELCKMDVALLSNALGLSVTQLSKGETITHGSCPFVHLIG